MAYCHACRAEIDEFELICPECEAPQDTTLYALPPDAAAPEYEVAAASGAGADSEAADEKDSAQEKTFQDAAPLELAPVDREAREIFARFLVSNSLREPFELEPGALVRIGRSRNNEICFPSGHVSRLHAEVVWQEGRWYVGDLGSKNGTFVNGERIIRRALTHGDRIRVGHFELLYRELTREETQELLMGGGAKQRDNQTARISANEGFSGDLGNIRLVEVVQLLARNRKTGVMAIDDATVRDGNIRELHFHQGRIVHARRGETFGEAAALELLQVKKGAFHFRPTRHTGGPTITVSTDTLLFQALSA